MSKKYATFIVVLFCSFLGFFLAAGLLTPDGVTHAGHSSIATILKAGEKSFSSCTTRQSGG